MNLFLGSDHNQVEQVHTETAATPPSPDHPSAPASKRAARVIGVLILVALAAVAYLVLVGKLDDKVLSAFITIGGFVVGVLALIFAT